MSVSSARWWQVGSMAALFGILACDARSRDASANAAGQQQERCDVSEAVLFPPGSRAGAVDMDCDGVVDSISLARVDLDGVLLSQATIGRRTPYRFRALDGLPTLSEAVDLDGDGMRDLLLALVDESTVLPLLLRVTATDARPFDESKLDWRQLQYVWSAQDDQDSCTSVVAPRTHVDSEGRRYVRVRVAAGDVSCNQAPSVALIVRNGELQADIVLTSSLRNP